MKNKDIDVFIISFNRLRHLKMLVAWLEIAGFENIHIVDNASAYPPLLEYLKESKHKIHILEKNYGRFVVWECGKFKEILDNKYYIVSDCDILPAEKCPLNVTEYFGEILEKYDQFTKVGFALKIDDLPEHNPSKEVILEWERKFWINKIAEGLFDASIDTTFAFYRPGIYPSNKKWWKAIRTDVPYIARHLPWYSDSDKSSEEDIFYQNNLQNKSSFWSITDLDLLKKYNKDTWEELEIVYASSRWKLLQIVYRTLNFIFHKEQFGRKIGKKEKISMEGISDLKILQRYNKELVEELGTIYSSGGWKFFQKFSAFYSTRTNHKSF